MNKRITDVFSDEMNSNIFSILCYVAGIVLGTILYYKMENETFNKILLNLFNVDLTSFSTVFINKLCIYFIVFTIILISGLCIIGFPFINIVPLVIGFIASTKVSFYYGSYGIKGIGYSILLIIPEIAIFSTIILYTICISNKISRSLYNITKNKNTGTEFTMNSYIKSYLIIALLLTLICLLNSVLVFLFNSIIKF